MRQTAEEDYINVVNSVASKHDDDAFQNWAANMKKNDYRVIFLKNSNELCLTFSIRQYI